MAYLLDRDVLQPRNLLSVSGLVAAMQPTTLILWLSRGDSDLPVIPDVYNASDLVSAGPSVTSIHIGPHLANRSLSSVPFSSILNLGRRFPHTISLELDCLAFQPDASPCRPTLFPRFAFLESLTIDPGFAPLSNEAPVTESLLLLFPHIPRLRSLTASARIVRRQSECDRGASYPDPSFRLNRFVFLDGLSIAACAHIIAHSSSTLDELEINFAMVGADTDDARLVAALAQAAPRLRSLRVLDILRRGVHALRSVSYLLARVETLSIQAPLALPDALALLDSGGVSTLRTLSLWCTRDRSPVTTAELLASLSRVPLLRSLVLRGFEWVDGDDDRRALLAACGARRIQCSISD